MVCFCDELVLEAAVENALDVEEDGLGRGKQRAQRLCWDVGEDLVDDLLRENGERHCRQMESRVVSRGTQSGDGMSGR